MRIIIMRELQITKLPVGWLVGQSALLRCQHLLTQSVQRLTACAVIVRFQCHLCSPLEDPCSLMVLSHPALFPLLSQAATDLFFCPVDLPFWTSQTSRITRYVIFLDLLSQGNTFKIIHIIARSKPGFLLYYQIPFLGWISHICLFFHRHTGV